MARLLAFVVVAERVFRILWNSRVRRGPSERYVRLYRHVPARRLAVSE